MGAMKADARSLDHVYYKDPFLHSLLTKRKFLNWPQNHTKNYNCYWDDGNQKSEVILEAPIV